ncbi:MAG TPA: CpaF family protein [Verrucomicrobiae bacterium]
MKDKPAMLEVLREGERARLFRFTDTEIKIGFNPRCNLPLEPHTEKGSELLLKPFASTLSALNNPGAFQLNGTPCQNEMPIKPGDIITGDSYRITIRDLPGVSTASAEPAPAAEPPPAAAPTPKESEPVDEEMTRAAASAIEKPKAPEKKGKADLSYLYLFFGPVKEHLMDDDVSEIMINGPSQIYIERKGKVIQIPAKFANEQALQAAIMNVARSIGRFYDRDNPRLDARLPDGSRVHACIPPLSRSGSIVAIRKFRKEKLTIDQLVSYGSLTQEGARLLDVIVKIGRNLIVSGATSSGKTSVLNVLSAQIPEHDRILVLEDASELQLQQTHKVCFETRKADEYGKGEVSIRDLLHSALRLRPDRIVVGEIRSGEALDLLQAMNTGHEGSMSTIHANTPRDSLLRMETCALLSGIEIPLSALREQVGSAIHMVIQTARLHDGTRKITAITEVLGLKDQQYQLHDIYVFKNEGTDASGKIIGRHVFTGYKPSFYQSAQQHGFNLDGLFVP